MWEEQLLFENNSSLWIILTISERERVLGQGFIHIVIQRGTVLGQGFIHIVMQCGEWGWLCGRALDS